MIDLNIVINRLHSLCIVSQKMIIYVAKEKLYPEKIGVKNSFQKTAYVFMGSLRNE